MQKIEREHGAEERACYVGIISIMIKFVSKYIIMDIITLYIYMEWFV